MTNITDYVLKNQKMISFKNHNVVDLIVLTQIGYLNYDQTIFYRPFGLKTLLKKNQPHLLRHTLCFKQNIRLVNAINNSKRFNRCYLDYYLNIINHKRPTQFCAMTFIFKDFIYVCYRGTDTFICGWKEDVNFVMQKYNKSLIQAKEYLTKMILLFPNKKIIVGGHSKGGHLAVYAACMQKEKLKNHIEKIYDFDGLGFKKEFYQNKKYLQTRDKIIKIVPETCLIGTILKLPEKYLTIKSNARGIMQHDLHSWLVKGSDFIYVKDISRFSKSFSLNVEHWLVDNFNQVRYLAKCIFEVFDILDIKDLYDLQENLTNNLFRLFRTFLKLDAKNDKFIFKSLIRIYIDQVKLWFNKK